MFSPIFKKQISGKHPIQALDIFFWRVIKTGLVDDLLQSFRVVDHEIVRWSLVGVAPFLDAGVVFAGVRGCETGAVCRRRGGLVGLMKDGEGEGTYKKPRLKGILT